MNKKSIAILCLTTLYSVLFYHQHVGINFILFTMAAIGLCYMEDKEAFKSKAVIFLSIGALFSATFAFIHNSNLSMWTTFVALFVLPGAIINRRSSIIVDLLSAIYTTMVAPAYMIIDMVEAGKNRKGKGSSFLGMLKYLVPLVFVIIFFFIYRSMNPLFEKFTQEIAEIISVEWVFFTLGGLVLVYAFYKQQRNAKIDAWEQNWKLKLNPDDMKEPRWNEAVAFILLFVVLNIMLIVVNAMDVNYLYLGKGMPDGITHKEFVHNGVGMLILSIVLGIVILLYFFRGYLNFGKHKNGLKMLAILWVAQNIFMVVSTTVRNTMYVDAALLTYKRVGVYFWLLFALLGLITLFIKIYHNRSVWYLARYNFGILYIVLLISSAFDWDMVISDFNLNRARQMPEISSLDKNYLLSISEGNIAGLYSIKDIEGFEVDSAYSYMGYFGFGNYHVTNSNGLDLKTFKFLEEDYQGDWRSYSMRRQRVRDDIHQLDKDGMLKSMDLQSGYIKSVEPLKVLTNLRQLNLMSGNFNSNNQLASLNELPLLEKLDLDDNYISDLDTLQTNTHLTHLSLSGNELKNLKFLKSFPNLDSLDISRNQLITLSYLPEMEKLRVLRLSGNPITNIGKLSKLKNLKELSLDNLVNKIGKMPEMENLESLSATGSEQLVKFGIPDAAVYHKLTYLNLSSCNMEALAPLLRLDKDRCIAPNLTSLILSSNHIHDVYRVSDFKYLEYLDLSYNNLYRPEELDQLKYLKQLYLNNNALVTIEILRNMTQLKKLGLANNPDLEDFSVLAGMDQLDYLVLSGTNFNDLSNINTTAPLQLLNLEGCRINNWEQLKAYPDLTNLTVSYLTKEDVELFKSLKSLKYLVVSNTEEEVVNMLKKEMPGVTIYN